MNRRIITHYAKNAALKQLQRGVQATQHQKRQKLLEKALEHAKKQAEKSATADIIAK